MTGNWILNGTAHFTPPSFQLALHHLVQPEPIIIFPCSRRLQSVSWGYAPRWPAIGAVQRPQLAWPGSASILGG
jgi:hypothetical protein